MTDITQDTSVSRRRKSSEIKISVETHYVGCTKRESNKIVKLRTTNKNFSQIPLKLKTRTPVVCTLQLFNFFGFPVDY